MVVVLRALYTIGRVQGAGGAGCVARYNIFRGRGGAIVCMAGSAAPLKPIVFAMTALLGRVFQTRTALGNML